MEDQIIDRVRKLLALSQSPNEHEAQQAAAMAHKLMEKHAIDEAMLVDSKPDEFVEDELMEPKSQRDVWRGTLAAALAEVNRCKCLWSLARNGSFKTFSISIFGSKSDVASVKYLFAYCSKQIIRLSEQYADEGAVFIRNYRAGFADGISKQLQAAHEEARAEAVKAHGVSAEKALVRMDNQLALVDDFMKSRHNVQQVPNRMRIDEEAYGLGVEDGRNLELDSGKGIAAGQKRLGSGR